MIDWSWITTSGTTLLMVMLSALGIYIALLILTRITGLRSFAKMSSFDFAITVAFGSVLASTILAPTPTLLTGAFGMAMLYGIQYVVSTSRRLTATVEQLVDNEPVLVMAGAQVLSDHLDTVRMSEDDLRSKLRLAGVTHPSQVLAVVFETSGDVAVMKTTDEVDPWVFAGVRGAEHLPFMSDAA
ncbi:hypothetical protein CRI93_02750 [Longimonas halophila]|uniref:YetF C-terminal domain-containing protein n=1 Tax=Longimonas halophila TaxID=1469170 RepID=A0A2H3NNS5_9BACT|nr:YetF domain-containing protein [Longimonas halophila]PEN08694.1 hypothetical protein CRI93_02750 [Longimonas halophila]